VGRPGRDLDRLFGEEDVLGAVELEPSATPEDEEYLARASMEMAGLRGSNGWMSIALFSQNDIAPYLNFVLLISSAPAIPSL
jgi:hypothetical protein